MGKNEDEIQPLNPEESLAEVITGEDSPKSKSPRHGHSTSKEVTDITCKGLAGCDSYSPLLVPLVQSLRSFRTLAMSSWRNIQYI